MSAQCDSCGLPDPYSGGGDGVGSCDCERCPCGLAPCDPACACDEDDDDYPDWPDDGPPVFVPVVSIEVKGERL